MENIIKGDIIQGARWPEPIQVKLVEELGQGCAGYLGHPFAQLLILAFTSLI
jgi:hypothetical protein